MIQTSDPLRTILDFIRWGGSRFNAEQLFFGHGTDNALDEAAALILHALHLPPDLPSVYLGSRITDQEREKLLEILQRRIVERQPAAYLMQKSWFAGIELYVDERVLVPRSPIAELIENDFHPWLDIHKIRHVLDLGTGSGCIGIAVAMHNANATVDLVDISAAALAVATINVQKFDLDNKIRVIQSNLFAALKGERYDLIISNPPYVASAELAKLPDEYQQEPKLGLAGGTDGLDLVRIILREAKNYLEPDGAIIVEVGNSAATLEQVYPQVPFLWLTFERGGDGVFLLTAEQLTQWSHVFAAEAGETL